MKTSKNNRSWEIRLGKSGLIMLVVGLGVLVFGAFLLGIHVGRDIDSYPEKIARGIPRQLAETFAKTFSGTRKEKESKPQENETANLVFFDILTKKGGDSGALLKEEDREAPAPPAVIMAPGTPVKQAERGPATTPVPPVASPPVPAAPPPVSAPADKDTKTAKAPAIASPPPAPAKAAPAAEEKKKPPGDFSVQVVSYHDSDKARQLQKKLRGLGYTAEVMETDIPGKGKWYRVMVNGYQTRQDAEKAAAAMSAKVSGLNCVIRQQ